MKWKRDTKLSGTTDVHVCIIQPAASNACFRLPHMLHCEVKITLPPLGCLVVGYFITTEK